MLPVTISIRMHWLTDSRTHQLLFSIIRLFKNKSSCQELRAKRVQLWLTGTPWWPNHEPADLSTSLHLQGVIFAWSPSLWSCLAIPGLGLTLITLATRARHCCSMILTLSHAFLGLREMTWNSLSTNRSYRQHFLVLIKHIPYHIWFTSIKII